MRLERLSFKQMTIERFWLDRIEDESGISGTGRVAEGVIFSTGHCALNWLTKHRSVAFYDDLKTVEAIHGHNGKTRVVLEGLKKEGRNE